MGLQQISMLVTVKTNILVSLTVFFSEVSAKSNSVDQLKIGGNVSWRYSKTD